jgi:hypothetical protein
MPILATLSAMATSAIGKALGSAFISYSTHYGMTKLYNAACVPDGVWGFLQGMVTSGSPVCQLGVQVISSTQVSYSSIIMMGISRILLDVVAPSASSFEGKGMEAGAADAASSHI